MCGSIETGCLHMKTDKKKFDFPKGEKQRSHKGQPNHRKFFLRKFVSGTSYYEIRSIKFIAGTSYEKPSKSTGEFPKSNGKFGREVEATDSFEQRELKTTIMSAHF